jgi:hypothetical protein
MTDNGIIGTDPEQQVEITIAASTRSGDGDTTGDGTNTGRPADRQISSLRVMGFRTADKTVAFNHRIEVEDHTEKFEGTFWVKTGHYTLVFIANEDSDGTIDDTTTEQDETMKGQLDAFNTEVPLKTIYDLRRIYFDRSAFDDDKPIPLFQSIKDVLITLADDRPNPDQDNRIKGTTDKDNPGDPLRVEELKRLGVRLDLTMTLDNELYSEWSNPAKGNKKIHFKNIPAGVYLFEDIYNSGLGTSDLEVDCDDENLEVDTEPSQDGKTTTVTIKRIILPELFLAESDNESDNALTISINTGEDAPRTAVIAPNAPDYSIPRNAYLLVTATGKVHERDLEIEATIVDWKETDLPNEL